MRPGSVRTFGEAAWEGGEITPTLSHHEAFVARKTIVLRLHALAEELVKQVEADRYTVSAQQATLRKDISDLIDIHTELS